MNPTAPGAQRIDGDANRLGGWTGLESGRSPGISEARLQAPHSRPHIFASHVQTGTECLLGQVNRGKREREINHVGSPV